MKRKIEPNGSVKKFEAHGVGTARACSGTPERLTRWPGEQQRRLQEMEKDVRPMIGLAKDAADHQTALLASTGGLVSVGRIEGASIHNAQGDYVGHVENVLLDPSSGRIAYVLVSCGGFLGIGARYHPLPWSLLARDETEGGYRIALSREQLASAPCMSLRDIGEDDRLWRETTYDYYKVQPYWA